MNLMHSLVLHINDEAGENYSFAIFESDTYSNTSLQGGY